MAKTVTNLNIGECDVYYNEVELGHTKGGVEFRIERNFENLTADQFGDTAIDKILVGQKLTVTVYLAEPTKYNLNIAIPEARYDFNVNQSKLGLGTDSGYNLVQDAKVLRLHPRKNAPSNQEEDVYIWRAVSVDSVEQNYKVNEQRILKVTFEALVDDTRIDGYRLASIGDPLIS